MESEGQLWGPGGSASVPVRAGDPGGVPPPPPPWPVARGQGAEVGVLLTVPSHQATVAIRAACRSRFPSGPRAQSLPGRGEQGSSCPSLRLDRRLGRGRRGPAAAPSATVHPVACGPPPAPEILAGVSGASLSPRAPGRAGYKDTRSQEPALHWRVRQGSPCLPSSLGDSRMVTVAVCHRTPFPVLSR